MFLHLRRLYCCIFSFIKLSYNLQGCTNPNTYDSVMSLLPQFTLLLDLPFVDPTQSLAFPMNVIALLPYLLLHYEDANELCIMSAENIAQVRFYLQQSSS